MNKLNHLMKFGLISIRKSGAFSSPIYKELFYTRLHKSFSSSGGHGQHGDSKDSHGGHDNHSHHEEPSDYHAKHFDRVSYNKILETGEREKVAYLDFQNDNDTEWLRPRIAVYVPDKRYEVLIPYENIREDREASLLDKTEIQARIYNLLREFDFKPLDDIDFDADYEKELGLDSLEWTALLTSIEHEFHTVFEDTLYDHFRTINDFVSLLEKDYATF